MALLDLQDMENEDMLSAGGGGGGKSGSSKGCGNDHSSFSLLLC